MASAEMADEVANIDFILHVIASTTWIDDARSSDSFPVDEAKRDFTERFLIIASFLGFSGQTFNVC